MKPAENQIDDPARRVTKIRDQEESGDDDNHKNHRFNYVLPRWDMGTHHCDYADVCRDSHNREDRIVHKPPELPPTDYLKSRRRLQRGKSIEHITYLAP
jgi:hypothetical protein